MISIPFPTSNAIPVSSSSTQTNWLTLSADHQRGFRTGRAKRRTLPATSRSPRTPRSCARHPRRSERIWSRTGKPRDRSPPKKVGWFSTRMSYTVIIGCIPPLQVHKSCDLSKPCLKTSRRGFWALSIYTQLHNWDAPVIIQPRALRDIEETFLWITFSTTE